MYSFQFMGNGPLRTVPRPQNTATSYTLRCSQWSMTHPHCLQPKKRHGKDEAGLARSLPSSPLTFSCNRRRELSSSSSSPTSDGEQRRQKQSIKSDRQLLALFFSHIHPPALKQTDGFLQTLCPISSLTTRIQQKIIRQLNYELALKSPKR
jgi:hypothetical protein